MSGIIKIMALSLITLVLVLMSSLESHAAASSPDSLVYSFHFRLGDDLLMKDYRENKHNFDAIERWMTAENIARISNIKIVGSTSPEGNEAFNNELAYSRAVAVRGYILWKYPHIAQKSIRIATTDDNISDWMRAIEQDLNVPRRDRVLAILNSNASIQTKWANIQLLVGGAAEYIERRIFPSLRNAVSCVIILNGKSAEQTETVTAATQVADNAAISAIDKPIIDDATKPAIKQNTEPQTELSVVADDKSVSMEEDAQKILKPLFALKTNLLFDAASLLNVEVEVPIGKRWSVAGEWMFPWWLWEKKQNCLQVMSGNIEGRYWFGNRDVLPNGKPRTVMTGWFAGLYAGGGYYDLEYNRKGYQGEFFIAAGVSGGYAHTINRSGSLRMEYSLGVGYMQTDYRQYEAKIGADGEWHLYRHESGKYTWFGPTRAKISLVWMLDTNLFKKRGGRR